MLEIIPNWHPIFVHFTVALFSLSVGLFVVTLFVSSPLKEQWLTVARWTLWFGAGFTVITGLTGLDAYNTVAHDTPSHAAMTDHRNWAIATISLFLSLAVWSFMRVRRQLALGSLFIAFMVIAGGLLGSTAWHGGEVVYRFGLGVMSLPESEGEGHAHEHADGGGHGHASDKKMETSSTKDNAPHDDSDGHSHDNMSLDKNEMTSEGKGHDDGHDDGDSHEH
ncbi:MAG: DUF2231 domain-containing protein [Ectothiorhodospiraceae bacterium]|nr:DUF2231 domain-containing protein [Ectothiorhodospiraceae bacterium]